MVGTIIVVISYLLEPVQNFLYRRKKIAEYARLEWATTDSLQLQRAAYQGIGSGTWTGCLDVVPMTESGELMGDLPHSYHTGTGSSCTDQAKLSVQKLNPAPMSPPSTGEASEESNQPAVENDERCVSSAEQESVPIDSPHATEQGTYSSVSTPTVARMPPLTPALPPTQNNEGSEPREAHVHNSCLSGLEPERHLPGNLGAS